MSSLEKPAIAYLAPHGFLQDLKDELAGADAPIVATFDHLVLVSKIPTRPPVWVQNTWIDPILISIQSIGDGAKALRALSKKHDLPPRWALYSTQLHRRAELIQEQLPKLKTGRLAFDHPVADKPLSSWTLLHEHTILASPHCTSRIPNGVAEFSEDKITPPSRAYLKLWELFTVLGVRPKAGDRCLDLGSCPGGWTWVLSEIGCKVISVDKAPLAPQVVAAKNVEFRKKDAFALDPKEVGPIDWFFSDIICYPEKLFELVERWRTAGTCPNFVCTIKFQGGTDHAAVDRFRALPGANVVHLYQNKHELTFYLISNPQIPPI